MKKKTIWLVVSCLTMVALLLASCGPAQVEEEEAVSPPVEEEAVAPEEEEVVPKEKELAPEETEEPEIPTHFTTYTDEPSYFSISYPLDWEPFPSSMEEIFPSNKDFFKIYDSDVVLEGYLLVFTTESPREPGISGANVNIMVQSLSDMTSRGWLTLDEIVEAKLQRTEEIKQEYHEFSRINTIVGGREAAIIDWGSSYPDLDKKSRCVQMFMIADKLVWKVTCYVDSEEYDDFKDDLHAIVRSLRILK